MIYKINFKLIRSFKAYPKWTTCLISWKNTALFRDSLGLINLTPFVADKSLIDKWMTIIYPGE